MKMKLQAVMTLTFAALCMTSCGITKKNAGTTAGTVKTETINQTEGAISHVLYGEWTAFDINGTPVTGEERPYVIFDKSGDNPFIVTVYANNGCNTLNGQFSVTPGGKMKPIGEFASTMRMCDGAKYEMGFNLAVNYVTTYAIEQMGSEYLLYMKDDTGKNLMILRKADVGFLNGAWRVSRLNGKEISADKDLQMVVDTREMKLHGNAGCNVMNGAINIDPDKQNSVQFKNIATTRMSCPDMALEQEFIQALSTVVTAVPGHSDNTAELKDATGKTVISLSRMQLK